jgi:hypothetical protein
MVLLVVPCCCWQFSFFGIPYCPIDLFAGLEWRRRSLMPLLPFRVIYREIAFDMSALQHCRTKGVMLMILNQPGLYVLCRCGFKYVISTLLDPIFKETTKTAMTWQSSRVNFGAENWCEGFVHVVLPAADLLGGTAQTPTIGNLRCRR